MDVNSNEQPSKRSEQHEWYFHLLTPFTDQIIFFTHLQLVYDFLVLFIFINIFNT